MNNAVRAVNNVIREINRTSWITGISLGYISQVKVDRIPVSYTHLPTGKRVAVQ